MSFNGVEMDDELDAYRHRLRAYQMKLGRQAMYMNDYQLRASTTAVYEEPLYPITSLMVEAAEFADLFIKPWLRGDNVELDRKELISEAGDVLWNLSNALYDQGITLEEVADYNLTKLQDRIDRGVLKGSGGNR
mgnify:CR=1 FL=1